jgi:nitrate/nitrite-specific signal transduction histidine kinase
MHKNPSSSDNGSHRKTDALEYAQNINYTLYDISNAIRTKQNPEQLYDSVYRSLNKLITLPNFYIALYDPENRTIKF